MKKRLEYKDEKSHKFWHIETSGQSFTVMYGRIGTNGQSKTKQFESVDKALSEAHKLVAQKIKKGYQKKDSTTVAQVQKSKPVEQSTVEKTESKQTIFEQKETLSNNLNEPAGVVKDQPSTDMDPTIVEEVLEQLELDILIGFDNAKALFQGIRDMFYDEDEFDEKWLKKIIKAQLKQHKDASQHWQIPTDFDRLLNAFDQINREKIAALHNPGYTRADGEEEGLAAIKKLTSKGIQPQGFCYYHTQDLHRAVGDAKNLLIGFDSHNHDSELAVAVGHKIAEILRQHEFTVAWGGTVETRLEIQGIHWQKTPSKGSYNNKRIVRLMQESDQVDVFTSEGGAIDYYQELKKFDAQYGSESYANSFVILENEVGFFDSWLENTPEDKKAEYSQSMQIFANADGTGGCYAFWLTDGNTDVNKAPIICYGSEGAIEIVAENIKDLIKMLSFGAEGMNGSFYHCSDDDEGENYNFYAEFLEYFPYHEVFRQWMEETLKIAPVNLKKLIAGEAGESKEINKLQKKARKKLKKSFDQWQYQFYPSPEEEGAVYYAKQQAEYEKNKTSLLEKLDEKPSVDLYLALADNEMLLEDINFKQKEEYLQLAHVLEPTHVIALEQLAKEQDDRVKKTIVNYTKLIDIHPKPEQFYSSLAYGYERSKSKKDKAKAIDWYVKSINAKENGYDGSCQDDIVTIAQELKLDGIALLEESLTSGHNAETYKALYKEYLKKKDYPKASEYALDYIEHSDEQSDVYAGIADKFIKKEAFQEAILILKKTLPTHIWDDRKMRSYNTLGLCYLSTENVEQALQAFKAGNKLDKKEKALKENIHRCGNFYIDIDEIDKALEIFQYCIDHKILKKQSNNSLGICYRQLKQHEKALDYFERALKKDPENEEFLANVELAKKQLKKGRGILGKLFRKK